MIREWHYHISDTTDPYQNLATEAYLLEHTPLESCTLYLWRNENTVVIGRNQNPWAECRCALLEQEGGHLARRLSGGGAVYHDVGNLNFTFLCAEQDMDVARNMQVIATACRLAGIDVTVSGRNDVLADGRKFSGNAFYHAGGRAYHHGTLLVHADTERMGRYLTPPPAKLAAKGVKSVRSRVVNLAELAADLTTDQMAQYMLTAATEVFGTAGTPFEAVDADAIAPLAQQYGSWEYLYGAQPPFTASCEGRFSWGHAQLHLAIHKGVVTAANLYTDALDWTLAERVSAALVGCQVERNDIAQRVRATLPPTVCDDILALCDTLTGI
jgi:lipoate-protein ligase A